MESTVRLWDHLMTPDIPVLESFLRGTVLYFAVLIIMRTTLRRTAGELTMLDFIFVLLVANGASDSMVGGSVSVSNGLVIILTVVAWNYALNTVAWYIPWFQQFTSPPPLQIVRNGKMLVRNMRKEFITKDELMSQLREDGVEDIARVKAAYIEGDGNISVIPYDN
jgi:uncharacterized membrane protein YcaP (DUF421 family)